MHEVRIISMLLNFQWGFHEFKSGTAKSRLLSVNSSDEYLETCYKSTVLHSSFAHIPPEGCCWVLARPYMGLGSAADMGGETRAPVDCWNTIGASKTLHPSDMLAAGIELAWRSVCKCTY